MSDQLREKLLSTMLMAQKNVFGQNNLIEGILTALVCEGHLLIEGMPGLGKTLCVSTMSKLCDLNFKRIQFTPDLLPSDLIGTMVYNPSNEEFKTKFGPIFTQILLADEINRSPAKVQSALLEAMEEKQVTIGDKTHPLSAPFVVLATQNPIEQEGTYPLPEAQLDRFMMKLTITYPDFAAEKKILELNRHSYRDLPTSLSNNDILALQELVSKVYVDEKIKDLIVNMVQRTRPQDPHFPKEQAGTILAGASPRAGIWMYKIAKMKAFLQGSDFVSPDHLLSIVPQVLGHRIILSYEATIDKIRPGEVALKIAQSLI